VLAQEPVGRDGEPGVDGKGGDDRGDDPADEHAGQRADHEGGHRPGRERDPAQAEQGSERWYLVKAKGLVTRGEIRLVIPGHQHANGAGGGGQQDRQQHQLGKRPAPAAEALGPGVPEGAGLQFPRQQRRPGQGPDQHGHHLQEDAPRGGRAGHMVAHAVESADQALAGSRVGRMAGDRGGVGAVQRRADDPHPHRQRAKQRGDAGQREPVLPPGDARHPPPRDRPQCGVVLLRPGGHGQRGHRVTSDVGSRGRRERADRPARVPLVCPRPLSPDRGSAVCGHGSEPVHPQE
jgi:hypothetical protein